MKKTVKDFDLKGKKVIIRCDLNVPMDGNVIADDTEIDAAANPVTVDFFSSKDAIVFLYVVGDDAIPDSTPNDKTVINNNTTTLTIVLFFKLILSPPLLYM